jgi:hypothetical protein
LFVATLIVWSSCGVANRQSSNANLSATAFAEKIKELPDATILDVRTPGEFEDGHLDS